MKRIGELYRFELYKIFHSKLTVSVILIFTALAVIMGMQLSKGARDIEIYKEVRSLNGQVIDHALVSEMNADLGSIDGLEKEENYKYTALSSGAHCHYGKLWRRVDICRSILQQSA